MIDSSIINYYFIDSTLFIERMMHPFKWLMAFFFLYFYPHILISAPADEAEIHNTHFINQLYHSTSTQPTSHIAQRLDEISQKFLGKPYLLGALGEGPSGEFDQMPLYRFDAFDCETFVDTILALALAEDATEFKSCINQIRYLNAKVDFLSRNHFTCLDWNRNNQLRGFLKDITTNFKTKDNKPAYLKAEAFINKPAWYAHLKLKSIRLQPPQSQKTLEKLRDLKQRGQRLPSATSTIPYLPLSLLFDAKGKENIFLFKQIPHGSIIEIVRPNWDVKRAIGTNMNVSHLGFAFWHAGSLVFREASSIDNKIVDVSLVNYLRKARKSPTIRGINVQVVNKTATCSSLEK